MANQPLVSIITPAFNAERYLADTVASVRQQTYQNWEMRIVDDHSADRTLQLARDLACEDKRITVDQTPMNLGCSGARNVALEKANGQLVAFLDSDDQWLPDKLERQVKFMQKTGAALTYTLFRCLSQDGQSTGPVVPIPSQFDYKSLLKQNRIATLTAMVDVSQTGPIRMANLPRDDYILWLSILRRGFVAKGLQDDLARYRLVPGSVSSNKIWGAKKAWFLYRKTQDLNLPEALWYYLNYVIIATYKHIKYFRA